jgi:hypothetical protein
LGLDQNSLERRLHIRLEQMGAHHLPVDPAENGMEMQAWAVVRNGNRTDQRQDVHLLVDGDLPVMLWQASRNIRGARFGSRLWP